MMTSLLFWVVTCTLQVTWKCSRLTFTMQVTHSPRNSKRKKPKTEVRGFLRSPCAVACTLDLVGDKRSLLVVRDLLRGHVAYGELQNSPEGIPTNILADRLKRLEEAGRIAKSAYQEHPERYAYELTEKGKHWVTYCSRLCDGARNTYRVHGLWRVQRGIPGESEN